MPTDLPERNRRAAQSTGATWSALASAVPAALLALIIALPSPLVLPAFAILAVTAGLLLSLHARGLRQAADVETRERARDVVGMLLLIGFGAAMMTDVGGALTALSEVEAVLAGRRPVAG